MLRLPPANLLYGATLGLIIKNHFHFLLKALSRSKFIAKGTYWLLKRPLKNHTDSKTLFGVAWKLTKCSVTSHTRWRRGGHHCAIYKCRWAGWLYRSLTPRAWRDYKPLEARRLRRLASLGKTFTIVAIFLVSENDSFTCTVRLVPL